MAALEAVLSGLGSIWVLVPHDSQGQDYAPGLSLNLNAVCLGGVEGLELGEQGSVFLRAGLDSKRHRQERPLTAGTIFTVLLGALPAAAPLGPPAALRRLDSPAQAPGLRHLGWCERQLPGQELGATWLATCLGGVVAGSRPVCDLEWIGLRPAGGADRHHGLTQAVPGMRLHFRGSPAHYGHAGL
ncbi:hypothetical protein DFAR_2590009 [Desulfarculales bacterium]